MDWLKRLFFKNTNRKATTCECGKYSKCCREMKEVKCGSKVEIIIDVEKFKKL